ncbi:hypothetical protein KSP40_PGU001764 [Platanthera guangdongensis]|uniref:Uncharacterized protein n=1 Tax=Platanthera guangdongensis TaxID=2320717 RepID=A0ABR2M269_9ASPA
MGRKMNDKVHGIGSLWTACRFTDHGDAPCKRQDAKEVVAERNPQAGLDDWMLVIPRKPPQKTKVDGASQRTPTTANWKWQKVEKPSIKDLPNLPDSNRKIREESSAQASSGSPIQLGLGRRVTAQLGGRYRGGHRGYDTGEPHLF